MSIDITTLNNEAAAAKTFTLIGRDRQTAEWLNSSDVSGQLDQRIFIKQQLAGKSLAGTPMRRSLVQCKGLYTDVTTGLIEDIVVNLTVMTPIQLVNASVTNRKDQMAFIRNLVTATVLEKLANGEL